MKRALRISAILILLVAALFWAVAGANRGWTKTSLTRMEKDPVTEIEFPVVEKRFVPGVDLLGATFLFAGLLAISSLFVRTRNNT